MMKPMSHQAHSYRQTFYLGDSKMGREEFWSLLIELKTEWRAADYQLLKKNCHTFAQCLCDILDVAPIPCFVTRLPGYQFYFIISKEIIMLRFSFVFNIAFDVVYQEELRRKNSHLFQGIFKVMTKKVQTQEGLNQHWQIKSER